MYKSRYFNCGIIALPDNIPQPWKCLGKNIVIPWQNPEWYHKWLKIMCCLLLFLLLPILESSCHTTERVQLYMSTPPSCLPLTSSKRKKPNNNMSPNKSEEKAKDCHRCVCPICNTEILDITQEAIFCER